MKRVCVGIHLYAEPDRLQATLASLQANTGGAYDVLLLPDGPDEPTKAHVATLRDLPQSGTAEPRGAAACFNRLATASDADLVVLLENGALAGPGWLAHVRAALDADPRNGLAGPSTNHCWNEQGVYPQSGGSPDAVARTSQEAALRFGNEARTLEPLYSLADFCYAVRREVIETIGGADEAYALGPAGRWTTTFAPPAPAGAGCGPAPPMCIARRSRRGADWRKRAAWKPASMLYQDDSAVHACAA